MKYELVIFDLDGTVLNTLGDLSAAVNHALAQYGFQQRTQDEVRGFIGNGVSKLIARALPEGTPEEVCAQVLNSFKDYYRTHIDDNTRPYAGIVGMLSSLRNSGVRVGINSNKFDEALQRLCLLHFDGLFDMAIGESVCTPRKPDPTAALRMMKAFDISPKRAIYIGDSTVDITTARNAGCAAGWVSWGFRHREEMDDLSDVSCFDSPDQLRDWLLT